MTDKEIAKRLENHALHCKLDSNCPICWEYTLLALHLERKRMERSENWMFGSVAVLLMVIVWALLGRYA